MVIKIISMGPTKQRVHSCLFIHVFLGDMWQLGNSFTPSQKGDREDQSQPPAPCRGLQALNEQLVPIHRAVLSRKACKYRQDFNSF